MSKPRLLDLFCGAGGAAMGYSRAGFEVVGVDIEPQPRYPFEFHQGDALHWLSYELPEYDAIHASPPCQAYTTMGQRFADTQAGHPALIAEVRALLVATGLPYVIENVQGARAELDHPIVVCGRSVGCGVRRHRLFECSFPAMTLSCSCDGSEVPVYGKLDGRRLWTRRDGSELRCAATLEDAREAMGIDWMPWESLTQAIPPAMTEYIGRYLLTEVNRRRQEAAA